MDFFTMEPERYYDVPLNQKAKKDYFLEKVEKSDNYVCSIKKDGNWARFVKQGAEVKMQSRGLSVKGGYGEFQEKVPHLFTPLASLFRDDTILIGELYLPGGNDKDVGSILRCLPPKAIARQRKEKLRYYIFDVWYINGISLMDKPLSARIGVLNTLRETLRHQAIDYVDVARYYPGQSYLDVLDNALSAGEEGIVIQDIHGKPEPGKRPSWKSMKIKKELLSSLDVVCMGFAPATREYNGDNIENWPYWENVKTGELYNTSQVKEYWTNEALVEPVSKGYYHRWSSSIRCGVYKDGELVELCMVSNLSEELKQAIKENPKHFLGKPMAITGMELSYNKVDSSVSVRHPKFHRFRDDIIAEDCTFEKIFKDKV